MDGWFESIWIELQSIIKVNVLFFLRENFFSKHATKEKCNVQGRQRAQVSFFEKVCRRLRLMCGVRSWKTRRGKTNAKGVNEIISTFPVLWEVLWLTPPDSVEQETKLDPPDLGLKPKLTNILIKLYKWQTIQHGKIQIYFANYDIWTQQRVTNALPGSHSNVLRIWW